MYPKSKMSVESVGDTSLVFFKSRVYIPEKLREKTLKWYFDSYGSNAKAKLSIHCIWPDQEKDATAFERSR